MIASRFEALVRRRGIAPLDPIPTPFGRLLIADGFVRSHKDHPEPHYLTIWTVDREGKGIDGGRPLYCSRFSSREARIAAALTDAHQWIKDNRDAGRY